MNLSELENKSPLTDQSAIAELISPTDEQIPEGATGEVVNLTIFYSALNKTERTDTEL